MFVRRQRKMVTRAAKRKRDGRPVRRDFIHRLPGAMMVRGGAETKCVDVLQQTNIFSTGGVFTTLNATSLGNEIYNRIGRRLSLKSLLFRGAVVHNAAVAQTECFLRVIIFYDREGTTSVVSDLIESTDATGTTANTSFNNINSANFSRYVILADIQLDLPNTVATLDNTDFKGENNIRRYIKLRDLGSEFGSGGSISAGGLQVLVLGSQALANASFSLKWTSRLRYKDT